jgi:hypothetical protein
MEQALEERDKTSLGANISLVLGDGGREEGRYQS